MKKFILFFLSLPIFLLVFLGQVSNVNAASGDISASPNPCTITPGNNTCPGTGKTCCTSTVTWGTTDAVSAVVCVHDGTEEKVFALGTSGNQNADWIQAGIDYDFRLIELPYPKATCSGGTQLKSVKVTAATLDTPTYPTASITGPITGAVGQRLTFNGTAQSNGGNLMKAEIWVATSGRTNPYPYNCPGNKTGPWCNIGTANISGSSGTVSGSWTPNDANSYIVVVNAYNTGEVKCSGDTQRSSGWSDCGASSRINVTITPAPLPPPQNLQAQCSPDGTIATITWDSIPQSVAYVIRANADPQSSWANVPNLGTYNDGDPPQNAPTTGDKDFTANTQGNSSTTYRAKVVTDLHYAVNIQGVRQGEAYPYSGQVAGVDVTCTPVCDFNGNYSYDDGDIAFWRDIFLGLDTDPVRIDKADCSRDNAVNLVDFNRWRNMKYLNFIGN